MAQVTSIVFTDIMVVIGLFLEPGVVTGAANQMKIAESKKFLLLQWIMMAFFVSAAYRSVLLATMLAPAYENSIDTLDDLLKTEKEILVPVGTKTAKLLRLDPKEDVRTLHKKVTFYNIQDGKHPKPVLDG